MSDELGWYTGVQFVLFRIIFGVYLTVHFLEYIPYTTEMFSQQGIFKDVTVLPTYLIGISPAFTMDTAFAVQLWNAVLIISSICFTLGIYRRLVSLVIVFGWGLYLNRNPFISNPSIGCVGWLLLACVLLPTGENDAVKEWWTHSKKDQAKSPYKNTWKMPANIYYGCWMVMALCYSASGIDKIDRSPSWVDGTALNHVLTGCLARPNSAIRALTLLYAPPLFLKVGTWVSLFMEATFGVLGTFYHLRKWYWAFFFAMHAGILFLINFTDLTMGMLMIQFFTFNPSWFAWSRALVLRFVYHGQHQSWMTDRSNHILPNSASPPFSPAHSRRLSSSSYRPRRSSESSELPSPVAAPTANTNEFFAKFARFADRLDRLMDVLANFLPNFLFGTLLSWICYYYYNQGREVGREHFFYLLDLINQMRMGFGLIVTVLVIMMILERVFPDQPLEKVDGWWGWVFAINIFQLFAVVLATFTWEKWLQDTEYFRDTKLFHLRDHVSPALGGFIAYVVNTWLFYHWHRARHSVYILWVTCHQLHHSATRLETITSFYKHPLEIVLDSQIMAIMLYAVLGLSHESSIWLSFFSACGEYFYHMNIKTPRWVGYIIQRPESHRLHHFRDRRENCPNFSDIPLFDILGGTFENPVERDIPVGFSQKKELQRWHMMRFGDAIHTKRGEMKLKKIWTTNLGLVYLLVIWGCLNSICFFSHFNGFRAVGFSSVTSPLPLVFTSYKGVETFATTFDVDVMLHNNEKAHFELDENIYSQIQGPYNRRNIYGTMFAFGPFFDDRKMLQSRQAIFHYALCSPGILLDEFEFGPTITQNRTLSVKWMNVTVHSKTAIHQQQSWNMFLSC